MSYVNEHFLRLFQNLIKIDFDDKLDDDPESISFWQMTKQFFGYKIDEEDIAVRAQKWNRFCQVKLFYSILDPKDLTVHSHARLQMGFQNIKDLEKRSEHRVTKRFEPLSIRKILTIPSSDLN